MKETTARWKTVFDYITEPVFDYITEPVSDHITEPVSDHVSKEKDPQFGPYDRAPGLRFLRWWD